MFLIHCLWKCGHKNLTNYRDQHRAANRNKSCDYLGISAILCIAADVWTLKQISWYFLPGKGKGYILAWYQACAVWLTELSRSAISEIFPPVWTSANYLGISIVMKISIFLVCECAYYLLKISKWQGCKLLGAFFFWGGGAWEYTAMTCRIIILEYFHTRAKVRYLNDHSNCAIWMIIQMAVFGPCVRKFTSQFVIWIAQFKWRSEWWYFGQCVRKFTSRCGIWIAQSKWRSFELHNSN